MFKVGDMVKRLPNVEAYDPPYEPFKDGNDQFLILEESNREDVLIDTFHVLSLKNGTMHKMVISNHKLWEKIS